MKARINGIDIAYDDHGIGYPVIFLHAFPLNRTMWTGQVAALLDDGRYRLVAPDWRGFGESKLRDDVSTMELLADDVAGLMDQLGMPSAVLCGLSMGGYAAFAFLRKYPQRLGGLILASTHPLTDTEDGRANREKLAQLALAQGSDAVAEFQSGKLLAPATRQHHQEIEMRVRQMIRSASPSGIAAASRGMAQRGDASDLLATIICPTLVIAGEHDNLVSQELVRDYAGKIPGAQCVLIPQAGHLVNLEQPETFQEVVRTFLFASF